MLKEKVLNLINDLGMLKPKKIDKINDEDQDKNRFIWSIYNSDEMSNGTLTLDLIEPNANIMWISDNGNVKINTVHNFDELQIYLFKYLLN